jgi:hypothetical protein
MSNQHFSHAAASEYISTQNNYGCRHCLLMCVTKRDLLRTLYAKVTMRVLRRWASRQLMLLNIVGSYTNADTVLVQLLNFAGEKEELKLGKTFLVNSKHEQLCQMQFLGIGPKSTLTTEPFQPLYQ